MSPHSRRLASTGGDGTLRLWDAASGALLRVHALWTTPTNGHAVWSPDDNRVISASDDAWRYLAWQYDNDTGRLNRLPLETFGPVPT